MNKPPDPPPPPKFELPSEDSWNDLTDEDRKWLAEAERDGRLAHMTPEWARAELEAESERFKDRLRRAGFDPDAPENKEK